MEKILGILSLVSLGIVLLFAFGLMIFSGVLKAEIPDRFASVIFIPIGLTFIFGILTNAFGGGQVDFLGKSINRRSNSFLYWSIISLPFALGAGIFTFGFYQFLK